MNKQLIIDNVQIAVYENRKEMGVAAARCVENLYQSIAGEKDTLNMIFAAAPSQNEFLDALCGSSVIDFSRINAFHMDEYVGLSHDSPQSFSHYLSEHLFSRRKFRSVNLINGNTDNPEAECRRYGLLLDSYPPDIVCAGVGENGHIAFNDPDAADFLDPLCMKVVILDPVCRQQQVNDGCFAVLEDVPEKAMTLTIPTLACARYKVFVVPSGRKAKAVHDMFLSERSEKVPASVIRGDSSSSVFLDKESAALLLEGKGIRWEACS